APLSDRGRIHRLSYTDANYAERLGWQEVVVAPAEGIELLSADVPQTDLSNALRAYPVDLLQDPPAVHSAELRWQAASGPARARPWEEAAPAGAVAGRQRQDRLAELVALPDLGPWQVTLALLAAFVWGAAHALSPGHGKTIVAAYLVGARGTWRHAAFLGATTTITHTIGVFALGIATLLASQVFLPERIYPWLSALSGGLVVAIGLSLGWSRLRSLRAGTMDHHHGHAHHSHGHSHDDAHSHAHPHVHEPDHDPQAHHHSHAHHHPEGDHEGHHGGHSHLPPGADGRALTWRSLLALGISGGLLPCPSALVVLLGAVALGRVGFGLLLILVFSLGLASVLTAIGLALLHAGRLFERIPESGRYARHLAIASAAFIVLLGAGITLRALLETGMLAGS
ncbi:MAG TPA: sulfite exporter TauE/SafE family protein, partial [Caldilineaceae bacterium]|nr:sulfite exporter TauE/SafE family protein [Caldilineaceae bacterium]